MGMANFQKAFQYIDDCVDELDEDGLSEGLEGFMEYLSDREGEYVLKMINRCVQVAEYWGEDAVALIEKKRGR